MHIFRRFISITIFVIALWQAAQADLLEVTLQIDGMVCQTCAAGLTQSLARHEIIMGKPDIDYAQGSARIGLAPKNRLTIDALIKQLSKIISQAGFTLKGISHIIARGKVVRIGKNRYAFAILGTADRISLTNITGITDQNKIESYARNRTTLYLSTSITRQNKQRWISKAAELSTTPPPVAP